ncbi:MAG: response regulator [Deltaproteobacteria bacterium]|nr:response regulator [Candidatus Tharpella aukensis]
MTETKKTASKGVALIIEDNEDNLVLISALLKRDGYRVIVAMTGLAGVEMALKEKPDLIILDIQLPDINGIEVLRKIRAKETESPIPVIAMTSYAMIGDEERLMNDGCTGYIEKPIDPTRVLGQIDTILEEKR